MGEVQRHTQSSAYLGYYQSTQLFAEIFPVIRKHKETYDWCFTETPKPFQNGAVKLYARVSVQTLVLFYGRIGVVLPSTSMA